MRVIGRGPGAGGIDGGGGMMANCVAGSGAVRGVIVTRVDATFCRRWSRWPCIIGRDCGGYLRTSLLDISGNEFRNPASSASHKVDRAGLPKVACINAMRCARVASGGACLTAAMA